jgi:hypothetical protein
VHLPLAFSIHHFISSVGADAGFAAIIGLAILVLLYFAQARETTTLRDEAISASQRVEQLERRVAQLGGPPVASPPESIAASTQAGAPAPAGQAAPPPAVRAAPARAAANPVPTATPAPVRAPLPQPSPGPSPTPVPAAPAGVGAPALTDATRLIPTVEATGQNAPPRENQGTPQSRPQGAREAVSEPQGPPEETAHRPAAPAALATPPPATAAAGAGQAQPSAGADQAQAAADNRPAPVAANGGVAPPRARPAAASSARQGPPRVQGRDGSRKPGRLSVGAGTPTKRWLPVVLGVLLLGVVAAVLIVATAGGGSPRHAAGTRSTNAPVPKSAFNPASVTVAVLNGTDVSQLAHRVDQKLSHGGYKGGTVATAADQTHRATLVGYLPGYQSNAIHVASSLGLSSSAVQPVDQSARAIACPPASACGVSVVVTVGSDLASTK